MYSSKLREILARRMAAFKTRSAVWELVYKSRPKRSLETKLCGSVMVIRQISRLEPLDARETARSQVFLPESFFERRCDRLVSARIPHSHRSIDQGFGSLYCGVHGVAFS